MATGLKSVLLDTADLDTTFFLLTSDAKQVAVNPDLLASHKRVSESKHLLDIGSVEGAERVCQISELTK
jgi:hypothetical protein